MRFDIIQRGLNYSIKKVVLEIVSDIRIVPWFRPVDPRYLGIYPQALLGWASMTQTISIQGNE